MVSKGESEAIRGRPGGLFQLSGGGNIGSRKVVVTQLKLHAGQLNCRHDRRSTVDRQLL